MSDLAFVAGDARVQDLVPGDPREAELLAARLDAFAHGAAQGARQLRALDHGAWKGPAADAFRTVLGEQPARLERGAMAFSEAAAALRLWAYALTDAQAQARRALAVHHDAAQATARWQSDVEAHRASAGGQKIGARDAAPPPDDPGAPEARRAGTILAGAREDIEAVARTVRDRLEEAASHAPKEPSLLAKATHLAGELAGGVWHGAQQMLTFAFKLTPVYLLVDTEGYAENLQDLGSGLAHGVTHPVELAKAVTNWDMWFENPARALGELVPGLALAIATGGAGAAAEGSGALAAKGVEGLEEVAVAGSALRRAKRIAEGADSAEDALFGTIRNVNPRRPGEAGFGSGFPNRFENCGNCSIATDATLAGHPASALPGLPVLPTVIERQVGGRFQFASSINDISEHLVKAGPGSRGIVYAIRDEEIGHVFNVVNQKGVVRFLDGQTGGPASLEGYSGFRFLQTR